MRAPPSLLSGLLLAAALLAGASAWAGDDHDRAREALRDGRILPLERIAALAKQRFGGDILDVELEDEDDGFRYELKLIAGDGRIMKLEYDAATGELLRAKTRDRKPERR
ncbi:PepSY domain-containing protein [Azospirillum agricola]|uniref:PepSY domain-containing protein n=1 Tax=Azospirillum agricola TaxID=1720247 RepID=UPI000A0F06EC|nr:PepSY domain-containing protein [Azospirillum agricola]SMH37031.1 Peptidase propeptide and YPEB domain-containing protein [Azospirillum lipoferum]